MKDGITKGSELRVKFSLAWKCWAMIALSLIFFTVAPSLAAAEAASGSEPPKGSGTFLSTFERSHDALSREIDAFSERIDLFLGGDRTCEDSKDSYIQAGVSTVFLRGGGVRFDRVLRARIDLPKTQNRFRILLESDPERNFREPLSPGARSTTESTALTPQGPGTSFSAALQYVVQERRKWFMSLDGGIQVELPPDPFARARLKRSFSYDHWRFTFGETLFWFVSLGPGESTQFDIEKHLSSSLLFRSTSEALYKVRESGFDLTQTLSLFQELSGREVLTYKIGVTGESKEDTHLRDWGLGVEYRRRIYKNWLYLSIEPAVVFSQANDFRADPSLRFTIDISFGPKFIQ